ncbi:DUF5753 domain-containing protein [Streptomyces olivaceus]|uniref:Scr1 family TA system antitoxin-like transcriptional regulator n=1 Tax=Streptomyces olivaceus TaxID=47716 RepID=UPI001CCA9711|nr:Scr1 family TA system antitoxin-like transcriptional regulator [Streptomyces olivaceus]MBZ6192026.1 DUF5753 domain-containing protein [Streptomyces olivaceus]
MSVESAARISRVWNPALVPLLLRTPAYARAVEDALRTGPSPAMRERRTLQIHPEGAPPHPLTGVPALSLYRVDADLPDHVVREVGLPGTADVWDSRYTVTAYRMLMDRSCAMAPHPTKTKEVLA